MSSVAGNKELEKRGPGKAKLRARRIVCMPELTVFRQDEQDQNIVSMSATQLTLSCKILQ